MIYNGAFQRIQKLKGINIREKCSKISFTESDLFKIVNKTLFFKRQWGMNVLHIERVTRR